MKYYLVFDVGGTEIKGNVINQSGEFYFQDVVSYPAKSDGSKEEVMGNLVFIIESVTNGIKDSLKVIAGIGFAFPGPFDYENGVCLIQGLGKYEALHGVNVRNEVRLLMESSETMSSVLSSNYEVIFENDAKLFAIGESEFLEGNIACFTLGTGCGSTFISNGAIIKGERGIPKSGMIYDQPFRSSIVDDYISVRGLAQIISSYFEEKFTGKEIFELTVSGNELAEKVFIEFGELLNEALREYIEVFQADVVIFGGQISKSYPFFKSGFIKSLEKGIEIKVSENTSRSTMYGLYLSLISIES